MTAMMFSMLKYYVSASNAIRDALLKNQRGAALIEYVLIASLISVVAIIAMRPLGERIRDTFNFILQQLPVPGQ